MTKKKGNSVLTIVKKYHPNVTTVIDATEPLTINVSRGDCKAGKFQEPDDCAMAKALKRDYDGAIISLSTAYVIDGHNAYRYKVPESVAREIVSFDRNHTFAPGEYSLRPPSKSEKAGHRGRPQYQKNRSVKRAQKKYHKTAGIRSLS